MRFTTFIDAAREEEVLIYAHRRSSLVEDIERLISEADADIIGYRGKNAHILEPSDICCFTVEDSRVYAVTHSGRYLIKYRLYKIEEILPDSFIRINQSCVANIRQIRKFDASFSGTLRVVFKCGHSDYVSRRNLKKVKERLGL